MLKLINNCNFWIFPCLFFRQQVLIKIKDHGNYYVSNFMDIWTLKETILDKQYEQFIKVKKNDLVVDIGAAIGDFTISVSKKAKQVIAYECDSERLELMRKNINLNRSNNIEVIDKKVISLNTILQDFKIVNFLKIDCEGCEYQIFKNADQATLNKINFIAMEAHFFDAKMENDFAKLINKLKNNGFQIKIFSNTVHDNICYVFADKK